MLEDAIFRSNLEKLCQYYSESQDSHESPQLALMISKLAVLELCGWIEEWVHDLARSCVLARSDDAAAIEIMDNAIKNTHGIHYQQHVQPLLSVAIGASRLTAIERKLSENGKFDLLRSELGTVQKVRNLLAHTYTHDQTTRRIDAPITTMQRFKRMLSVLKEFNEFAMSSE